MELTAQNVETTFNACIRSKLLSPPFIIIEAVEGIFAFSEQQIEENRNNISSMLGQLALNFYSVEIGGWPFIMLNFNRETGEKWTESQQLMDKLVGLGMAAKMITLLPRNREEWDIPNGWPVVLITD